MMELSSWKNCLYDVSGHHLVVTWLLSVTTRKQEGMVEIERQKYYGILVIFYHVIHTQLQIYAYHPLTIVIEYT